MTILFANNAKTTTTTASLAPGTLTVDVTSGTAFPSPTGGDYFYATLTDATESAFEIVKVTAKATNTMTIVRAQEGTTAQTWASGSKFELRLTKAGLYESVVQGDGTMHENATTASTSYTLSTGKNAFSVGPISVASGAVVTVPSGQRWVVL